MYTYGVYIYGVYSYGVYVEASLSNSLVYKQTS